MSKILNWFSKVINRQTWIISLFSLIGAGFVLGVSLNVFIPETKLILNQIYVKKTIIIGQHVVEPVLANDKTTNEPDQEDNAENTDEPEVGELSIEQQIRNEAEKLGFKDVETLVKIAKCESSLKPSCLVLNHESCVNPINKSYDRGMFQISRKWHPEVSDECSFDLKCAVKSAIDIHNRAGWNAWACWDLIQ